MSKLTGEKADEWAQIQEAFARGELSHLPIATIRRQVCSAFNVSVTEATFNRALRQKVGINKQSTNVQ